MKDLRPTILVLLAAVTACGGDSPSQPDEPPSVAVRTAALTNRDAYFVDGGMIWKACEYEPTFTNTGTRTIVLDSLIFTRSIGTVVRTINSYEGELAPGREVTPQLMSFRAFAGETLTLTTAYRDGGRARTAATLVPCAGKASALSTGRSGALTVQRISGQAGSSGSFRLKNTTAGPVEFAATQVALWPGMTEWRGEKVGRVIAPGDSLTFFSDADVRVVGYFAGDLFGSTTAP